MRVTPFASATLSQRERVIRLEGEMKKLPQVQCRLVHRFARGLYLRELHIPAGVLSTGKIHKHAHIGILLQGVRDMLIDGELRTVTAPCTLTIAPGEKLACYTWEDSIYVTVHANPDDERDIGKLEARYVCDTEDDYRLFAAEHLKVIECRS